MDASFHVYNRNNSAISTNYKPVTEKCERDPNEWLYSKRRTRIQFRPREEALTIFFLSAG